MKILSRSVLQGEVVVEGEGIYPTVNGYNTQPPKNLFIKERYSFVIDPAEDLYTFTFDNAQGQIESSVEFRPWKVWTRLLAIG